MFAVVNSGTLHTRVIGLTYRPVLRDGAGWRKTFAHRTQTRRLRGLGSRVCRRDAGEGALIKTEEPVLSKTVYHYSVVVAIISEKVATLSGNHSQKLFHFESISTP